MTLQEATKSVKDKLKIGFDAASVIRIDLGADGVIVIDATKSPPVVSNAEADAEVTVTVSLADLSDILSGAQNAQMAFISGKLTVDGDMSVAMKLAQSL